jgi:cobalt-zinc-cadmium efflux system outer membrane protein
MYRNLFGVIVCLISVAHAEDNSESSFKCSDFTNVMEVLNCTVSGDTHVKRSIYINEGMQNLPEKFSKWSNPEFDLDSIHGNGKSETEVSITQTIDIGGKRNALVNLAKAQLNETALDVTDSKREAISEAYQKLHRLRQFHIEGDILIETEEAITKSISQLRNRSVLSPEQDVSQSVYRMALSDIKLKKIELFEEIHSIENYFFVSAGLKPEQLKILVSNLTLKLPDVSETPNGSSPNVLKAMAQTDIALAELEEARSEGFPTLKLGPVIKREKEGDETENSFGVRVSFDLPIFNTNSSNKANANSNLLRAQKLVKLTEMEDTRERELAIRVYKKSVEGLNEIPSLTELKKIHQKTNVLEKRGLISSSLLIESLRQRLELVKGRHTMELKALGSLLNIYKIDGKKIEELI